LQLLAGEATGTVLLKPIVDELRQEGVKAGLLRLRTFRPFPVEEVRSALGSVKAVAVMDKSMSFGGNGGAVFHEVRSALYDAVSRPLIVNFIYGLGGRDAKPVELRRIFENLQRVLRSGHVEQTVNYLGLRE
jgi:pyruvate ferredoxin oxidoreductase alpha subunit